MDYREVTCSNPIEVLNFFTGFLFFCNCINCVDNYEDHSSFCFLTVVIVHGLIPSCYRPLRAYSGRYAFFFCHLAVYPQTWPRVAEVYNSVEFRITRETCVDRTAKRKHVLAMQWNPDFSNLLGKWSPFVVQFYEVVDAIPKHLLTKSIYRNIYGELSDLPFIQPSFQFDPALKLNLTEIKEEYWLDVDKIRAEEQTGLKGGTLKYP